MPMSRSTSRAKRASTFAGIMPWTRWVPERSRNASSIDSGSTSGVSVCMAWRTSRPTPDIFRHVRPNHDRGGAERQRLEHRHRRAHAIGPRDVAGGRDHAALAAADDDRLVGKLRVVALLHRGVERVAIDMRQRQRRQRVVANEARGAAFAASPGLDVEVAEAIPAKTARTVACLAPGALTARRAPNAGRPAPDGRRRCWSDGARRRSQTPSRSRHRA